MSSTSGSKVAVLATLCVIVLATRTSVRTILAQNTPDDFMNAHNAARAAVGVGLVSWDESAAAYASNYANERINDCQLIYSGGPYDENIFSGSADVDWTAQDAVDSWIAGQLYYDYASYTCSAAQVLSTVSTSIGCARVVCTNGGGIFITCSYSPPDNIQVQGPH